MHNLGTSKGWPNMSNYPKAFTNKFSPKTSDTDVQTLKRFTTVSSRERQ